VFESSEKHVTRNVYTLLLAFSLANYFCEITKFYYLQLQIGTFDGAVADSIHDRTIKIIL